MFSKKWHFEMTLMYTCPACGREPQGDPSCMQPRRAVLFWYECPARYDTFIFTYAYAAYAYATVIVPVRNPVPPIRHLPRRASWHCVGWLLDGHWILNRNYVAYAYVYHKKKLKFILFSLLVLIVMNKNCICIAFAI